VFTLFRSRLDHRSNKEADTEEREREKEKKEKARERERVDKIGSHAALDKIASRRFI